MNDIINLLPKEFVNRINDALKEEAVKYYQSFDEPSEKGIHVNAKRISTAKLTSLIPELSNNKMSYYDYGFYDNSESKIGHNPLNHAGALYSQDPAAMMPVSLITNLIKPDYKVLDLCSAPGGKASQAAMLLDDTKGFLVANEINPSRNKILCSNIERMGYKNVLITKLEPAQLEASYQEYFDVVIVDAPCSGEGMFRKYPESISEWSLESVNLCALRQKEILSSACNMLKPGGILLYSTCTYSDEEDNDIITWLIENYNYSLIKPDENIINNTKYHKYSEARTFYPYIAKGEGQFMCALTKPGISFNTSISNLGNIKKLSKNEQGLVLNDIKDYVSLNPDNLYKYSDRIIYIENPNVYICNKGVTSAFVCIGTLIKNRFSPEHGLFHCLGDYFTNYLDLDYSDERIYKYLHGEEILDFENKVNKGYGVLKVNGCSIGGFKASNGRLKNHYPKGLRNNN